jgi:hypothetical protein
MAPRRTTGRRDGDLGWTDADADGPTDARGVGVPPGRGAPAVTAAVGVALAFGATVVDGVGSVVGRTGTGLVDPPDVPVGEATAWDDVGGSVTRSGGDEVDAVGSGDRAGIGALVCAGCGEGNADGSSVGALDASRGCAGDGAADRCPADAGGLAGMVLASGPTTVPTGSAEAPSAVVVPSGRVPGTYPFPNAPIPMPARTRARLRRPRAATSRAR